VTDLYRWAPTRQAGPFTLLQAADALRWREPRRVEVDIDPVLADREHMDAVWAVMHLAHASTFYLSTARPAELFAYLTSDGLYRRVMAEVDELRHRFDRPEFYLVGLSNPTTCPLRNVHVGLRADSQAALDAGIEALVHTPAAHRWVDLTMGEEVSLDPCFPTPAERAQDPNAKAKVQLVRVRGETGPGARPMHPNWVRDLRDACEVFGAAFVFEGWGDWRPREPGDGNDDRVMRIGSHGRDTSDLANCTPDMGEKVYMQRVFAERSGRLLDGRTHDWPEAP